MPAPTRKFRVYGPVRLNNGRTVQFSTFVTAINANEAKGQGEAQMYHQLGYENIKTYNLSVAYA